MMLNDMVCGRFERLQIIQIRFFDNHVLTDQEQVNPRRACDIFGHGDTQKLIKALVCFNFSLRGIFCVFGVLLLLGFFAFAPEKDCLFQHEPRLPQQYAVPSQERICNLGRQLHKYSHRMFAKNSTRMYGMMTHDFYGYFLKQCGHTEGFLQ